MLESKNLGVIPPQAMKEILAGEEAVAVDDEVEIVDDSNSNVTEMVGNMVS